jgi:intracellular sulfur oxidation DsrE/DsrF family protein
MNDQKKIQIKNFFEKIEKENKLDFTFSNIDVEEIDLNNPFESIQELLQENGDFDIEIIYYNKALEYLKENDPSLRFSLEIADSMGFSFEDLNSETLASLLASENAKEEFSNLKNEIEEFFNNLS